jgi:hypothetical protein
MSRLWKATDAPEGTIADDHVVTLTEPRRVVWVDRDCRGSWEVVLPDGRAGVACETLDDARRLAFLYAARILPCELVVRDAYHRVIDHEMIDRAGATAGLGHAR